MADLPSKPWDPSADGAHGHTEWPAIPGYQIEARVGAGGMAVVFRARDERLRRPVALKILAGALAADDGFRRRFVREARAAAMVDHPHIIPVFEAGEADGLLFIAMRFVAGGDVRSLLNRSGAMSAGRATGIVSAMASALDAAHRAGLVHRDVKPANMLIDVRLGRPDHVYLSDFGLSKGALSSGAVTRAGHVVGPPAYLAPEQAAGGKVDGRADQYSLACVAYELLTGMPPFLRDDAAAMVYAHLMESPPRATARLVAPGRGQHALLFDISVTAADGWASGLSLCQEHCRPRKSQALILHWDSHSWSRVMSPDTESSSDLFGITAAGRTAWAVGSRHAERPASPSPHSAPSFSVGTAWTGGELRRAPSVTGRSAESPRSPAAAQ